MVSVFEIVIMAFGIYFLLGHLDPVGHSLDTFTPLAEIPNAKSYAPKSNVRSESHRLLDRPSTLGGISCWKRSLFWHMYIHIHVRTCIEYVYMCMCIHRIEIELYMRVCIPMGIYIYFVQT